MERWTCCIVAMQLYLQPTKQTIYVVSIMLKWVSTFRLKLHTFGCGIHINLQLLHMQPMATAVAASLQALLYCSCCCTKLQWQLHHTTKYTHVSTLLPQSVLQCSGWLNGNCNQRSWRCDWDWLFCMFMWWVPTGWLIVFSNVIYMQEACSIWCKKNCSQSACSFLRTLCCNRRK